MIIINGLAAFEHGGNLYEAVRESGGCLADILDFSANINPLGIPACVRQAIYDHLESIAHYPDAKAYALKSAISNCYEVASENITVGNGAVELLYLLCHTTKPSNALIIAPTFSEYERSARAAGANIHYFFTKPEDGFTLHVDLLLEYLDGNDIDIIFLCNPNNPTGSLTSRQDIITVLKALAMKDVKVVIDESFLDFLPNEHPSTCRPLLSQFPNLVILCSLTKFYAIPGLRLGFCLTNAELTARMHAQKDPWNVNSLAHYAGVAALQDKQYRINSKEYVQNAASALHSDLQAISGLQPFKPSANFILVDIHSTGIMAKQLRTRLSRCNILIRDCSNYPGLSNTYIRLAVKRVEQNTVLVNTLQQIIAGETYD